MKSEKEKLVSIKENFNKLMEAKILDMEKEEALYSIKTMPFYKVKNLFESLSSALFNDEKTKHLVSSYITTIKSSKPLSDIYWLNESVNKGLFESQLNSTLCLKESLDICKKNSQKELNKSLNKLREIVKEGAKAVSLSAKEIKEMSQGNNNMINESLDFLIHNEKNPKNFSLYLSNFTKVSDFINENRKNEVKSNITENIELENIVNDNMEEWEKEAIRDISLSTLAGKDECELFEDYKKDCLVLIAENLKDEEVESRAHLETMKLQLEAKQYNKETYIDDILKLSELKKTLD